MDIDSALLYLKLFMAFLTGILGLIGLLFKFRDDNGQITAGGFTIIFGIIISLFIAFSITVYETRISTIAAKEQLERTQNVLIEFNRTQQPIKRLYVTYHFDFPEDDDLVNDYIEMIERIVSHNKEKLMSIPHHEEYKGFEIITIDINEEPISISIEQDSLYWPKNDYEVIARVAFASFIGIHIFTMPIEPNKFFPLHAVYPKDKFKYPVSDFIANGFSIGRNALHLDYQERKLSISGRIEFSPELWLTNGNIRSIIDLHGSQIFIVLPSSSNSNIPQRFNNILDVRAKELSRKLNIGTVFLSFAHGHQIAINGKNFSKTKYVNGYPVYSLIMPKDDEGITALSDGFK